MMSKIFLKELNKVHIFILKHHTYICGVITLFYLTLYAFYMYRWIFNALLDTQ